MKLLRFSHQGRVGIGLRFEDDWVVDVTERYPTVGAFLSDGTAAVGWAPEHAQRRLPMSEVTLLAPVDPGARVYCVALNYHAHVVESGGDRDPDYPVIFLKPYSALIGPDEPIIMPAFTNFLDYEAELAVVIGRGGASIPAERALKHVGGYTCLNDISARDQQVARLGQRTIIDWFSAKCADKTTPVGPEITLASSVSDPSTLPVRLRRNGELLQDGTTGHMINPIPRIIEYISTRNALKPGDVIATGTPAGVGQGRGIRLQPGDLLEVEIPGVGLLRNRVA